MTKFHYVFPESAPTANPVFFRTYSRMNNGVRESWIDVYDRVIKGFIELGKLEPDESNLIGQTMLDLTAVPSGRWLWVGGTEWSKQPLNYPGGYNCTSTNLVDWDAFGLMMDLAMMGCGTGTVIEDKHIKQLPQIVNRLEITMQGQPGDIPSGQRNDFTVCENINDYTVKITVGDSRAGWVSSYKAILELSSNQAYDGFVDVIVDIGHIRSSGSVLKGFGGIANPIRLPDLYTKCANILNQAVGRQLNSLECCLLIDEAAIVVVAGNIRRSAGLRLFSASDSIAATAKDNLWQQDANGNWRIDPARDALRMANHTRAFHRKPTLDECVEFVKKQYYSGEGAIQWAGAAVVRSNIDILNTKELQQEFLVAYENQQAEQWLSSRYQISHNEIEHRLSRYGLNPCAEIIGSDFFCNLSEVHLNQINPSDLEEQEKAFKSAALSVSVLLNHEFTEPRYKYSRELDPIVGVSFTGLFDFFVNAFGVKWLEWWKQGRPKQNSFREAERKYLTRWKKIVHQTVWQYCDKHGLKRPNRCTTVQPSGTKSLLSGASPGWHPPKAQRFIRRITFGKNDPVALACIDYGYNVVPSQSDKDEYGNLLNDPFDPRCTEWLVEIPVEVNWANLPGVEKIDISQFSALAQFDFFMQVQSYYTTHNTSGTLELRVDEIEPLANRIYEAIQNDEGYISIALLGRFDDIQTFPRLPFEPIDKHTYNALVKEVRNRRKTKDFYAALSNYDFQDFTESGPAGCDSDKCLLP